jgi:protein SPT2
MDYKTLLSLAEKKQEMNDTINSFNIKRKSMNGSNSCGPHKSVIDAFKARKAKEEFDKRLKAQKEKERLLSLRAQNSKSMKKARMMKTRTKDNDFSRIVLTEEQIEEQRRVEEKLKKKNITDLCQRMKTRIDLEEEESMAPKKKLKSYKNNTNNSFIPSQSICNNNKNDKQINDKFKGKNNVENKVENKEKSRPKPVMSYEQLLNLAETKAKTEKSSLSEELMSEMENRKQERPMTQKEKDALKEELFYKQRANKGLARLPNPNDIKKNAKSLQNKKDLSKTTHKPNQFNSNSNISKSTPIKSSTNDTKQVESNVQRNEGFNRIKNNVSNERTYDRSSNDRQRVPQNRSDNVKSGQSSRFESNKSSIIKKMDNRLNARKQEIDNNIERQKLQNPKPNNDYKSSDRDINERARAPSPPRRPMSRLPPIGSTYRRGMYVEDVAQYVDDDYEEEDDDMSDFIDDGPEEKPEEEDYSRAIREIFGYDKRKYRNIDDDDIEEANFAQCMKEESHSLRAGIQEDLEDMRLEEEEKKRKMLQKKNLKR